MKFGMLPTDGNGRCEVFTCDRGLKIRGITGNLHSPYHPTAERVPGLRFRCKPSQGFKQSKGRWNWFFMVSRIWSSRGVLGLEWQLSLSACPKGAGWPASDRGCFTGPHEVPEAADCGFFWLGVVEASQGVYRARCVCGRALQPLSIFQLQQPQAVLS